MDDQLRLLQHMYEGTLDEDAFQALMEDEDLRSEHEELCGVKRALDKRSTQCPDAEVVATVVATAARPGMRDRRPVRRRLIVAMAMAATMALLVMAGIYYQRDLTGTEATALQADTLQMEEVPSWHEADELVDVHRRLSLVRARSQMDLWDESQVMSLDSLPLRAQGALRGLEKASTH